MVNPLIGNKDLRNDKNVKFSDASYLLYYAKNASIFFNTFLFWVMPYVKYLLWQYSICHQNQNVFRKKKIVLIFFDDSRYQFYWTETKSWIIKSIYGWMTQKDGREYLLMCVTQLQDSLAFYSHIPWMPDGLDCLKHISIQEKKRILKYLYWKFLDELSKLSLVDTM